MKTDLDRKLVGEDHIFRELRASGWQGNTQQLRLLALKGEELRRRWAAECNYEWANSETYGRGTLALEYEVLGMADRFGLSIAIQRDPRGCPVYVREGGEIIDDLNYNQIGHCLYWED